MTFAFFDRKMIARGGAIAALAGALVVAGCAGSGPNEQRGTAIGAGGGAVVGALAGGWQGAAIGAVAGGVVGNLIGRDMDERQRAQAEDAAYRAARENRRAEWGDRASVYGYAEPAGDYYNRSGAVCHDYVQYMTKGGRTYQDRTTICRDQSGAWARG